MKRANKSFTQFGSAHCSAQSNDYCETAFDDRMGVNSI